MPDGDFEPLSPQPVAEQHELLVAANVDELEVRRRQPAGKQRGSTTECHRRDSDKNLVQQAGVGELTHQFTAAYEPHVSDNVPRR